VTGRDRKREMNVNGLTREGVLEKVREHLSTELEVPAEKITESTRLREDLDADSLDLYELVMELEDTYGITVSEEEAAGIETVQQAVDFVAGRLGVTT
jgi:acyl carrier protein